MRQDSVAGGAPGRFPTTRLSAVREAGSADPEVRERGFTAIVEAYWKPAYKYVRVRWRAESEAARDLTQGFFARAFEKEWLRAYDARKGSFRTFLRTCLDGFVANERKAARRRKRDPGTPLLSLDFEGADGELVERPVPAAPDQEPIHRNPVPDFSLARACLYTRSMIPASAWPKPMHMQAMP